MATPTIRINQATLGAGTPGVSRADLITGQLVTLTDPANPTGTTWQWELAARPVGSSATLSGATTATATFTPDVTGTYLVFLTVDGDESWTELVDNNLVVIQRTSTQGGCAVKLADGTQIPAPGESVQFHSTEGWHRALDDFMRRVAARLPSADEKTDLGQLAGAARGTVWYANASGRVTRLAPGTSGHVLQTGGPAGDPSWVAQSGGTTIPFGGEGSIWYEDGASAVARLAPGTESQVLTAHGAAPPTWETPSSGGGTLDAAYDQGGAGAGRTINATDGAVVIQSSDAEAQNILEVSKTPGSAAAGNGIDVTMGANATGQGVRVTNSGQGYGGYFYTSGTDVNAVGVAVVETTGVARAQQLLYIKREAAATGWAIYLDHDGSASGFRLNHGGTGTGLDLFLDGSGTGATGMSLSESAVARTATMFTLTRDAVATGEGVRITVPGAGHGLVVDKSPGSALGGSAFYAFTNTNATGHGYYADVNGSGSALRADYGGTGDAVALVLDGSDTGAQALVVTETAVARTAPMLDVARDAAATGPGLRVTHGGTARFEVGATVTKSLLLTPFANEGSDLGSSSVRWNTTYSRQFNASEDISAGTTITAQQSITAGGSGSGGFIGKSLAISQAVETSGNPTLALFTGAAHTGLTAGANIVDIDINLGRTVQRATGAVAAQYAIYIRRPTYSFVGASTITDASTVYIEGPPLAGTNATITAAYALNIERGNLRVAGTGSSGGHGYFGGYVRATHDGSNPVFSSMGDPDTGLGFPGGDVLEMWRAGGSVAQFDSTGFAAPSGIRFNVAETTTKIHRPSGEANTIAMDISGTERFALSASGLTVARAIRTTPVALTDGATVTPDLKTSNQFTWTIGGNRTLANPTDVQAGDQWQIDVTQDGTGGRTITWGSSYKGPSGAAASTIQPYSGAGQTTVFTFKALTTTTIVVLRSSGYY